MDRKARDLESGRKKLEEYKRKKQAKGAALSAPVWTLLCGTGMFYVLPALIARIGGEEGGREFKINAVLGT